MNTTRKRYYLNKREGKLLGVCAGIGDYLGVDPLWVRVAVVMLTLLGHGITIPLYFVVGFLAGRRQERDGVDYDRHGEARMLRRRARTRTDLSEMDRRLAAMESHYATNSRLADEIERLR